MPVVWYRRRGMQAEAGIEEPAELETAGSGEEPAASGNGAQV